MNRIYDNTNCEGIEYAKISQLSSFDIELTQSDDSGRIYDFNFTALSFTPSIIRKKLSNN